MQRFKKLCELLTIVAKFKQLRSDIYVSIEDVDGATDIVLACDDDFVSPGTTSAAPDIVNCEFFDYFKGSAEP